MKTVSIADLAHGAASRAVRTSQHEPVLVTKGSRPAAWLVSASDVAAAATARGVDPSIVQEALELIALDLYQREVLSLGQAAKLAGMMLGDFIDLCGTLHVPVLWESHEGLEQDVASFAALLEDTGTTSQP